ncbi:MAG: 4a-hydroxytetrahydrobiopterin dehydratase [Candidatus Diapherotrites archaeon]|nr:4a-hydroxytetrahydrobiopterin dehydratase [Candidatus Diapherotrites archaeon]
MDADKAAEMLKQVEGWELIENASKIRKEFRFESFAKAMEFANNVAKICEEEGHHSEMLISFRTVTLTNYTHKINGLHENDFILAAKIGKING